MMKKFISKLSVVMVALVIVFAYAPNIKVLFAREPFTQVIPTISQHWSDYRVSFDAWNVQVKYFESPVINCVHFTLEFEYTVVHFGNPFGPQRVYVLSGDRWISVGSFFVSGFERVTVPIDIGRPVTIQGVAVTPTTSGVNATEFNWRIYTRDFVVEIDSALRTQLAEHPIVGSWEIVYYVNWPANYFPLCRHVFAHDGVWVAYLNRPAVQEWRQTGTWGISDTGRLGWRQDAHLTPLVTPPGAATAATATAPNFEITGNYLTIFTNRETGMYSLYRRIDHHHDDWLVLVAPPSPRPGVIPRPIPGTHSAWARQELELANGMGLIPSQLLRPDIDLREPITREEFAAVVVYLYQSLANTVALPAIVNPFTDTRNPYVLRASNADIMIGVGPTRFDPHSFLTREMAATGLTRAFKRATIPGWTYATDANFPLNFIWPPPFADDHLISRGARESVYFMVANNIIAPGANNMFNPRATTTAHEAIMFATTTREQALIIALRMVENLV